MTVDKNKLERLPMASVLRRVRYLGVRTEPSRVENLMVHHSMAKALALLAKP